MGVLRSTRRARAARGSGRAAAPRRLRTALGDGVLDGVVLAPVAAALVVVLAGTGTSLTAGPGASSGSEVLARQASASLTDVQSQAVAGQNLRPAVRVAVTSTVSGSVTGHGVAGVLLEAYRSAAGSVPTSCHLPVSLLAAIGEVESGSLAGRPLDAEHRTSVLGPVLDGNGFASIPDTDKGRWDGDATWDRAMGPMQFIPSTWRSFGVDGDGDGVAHPQDVEDASASAAAYLCYGGRDLSEPDDLRSAILSYNHSTAYEKLVMTYQQRYAQLGLDDGAAAATLLPSVGPDVSATPVGGLASDLFDDSVDGASAGPARAHGGPRKHGAEQSAKHGAKHGSKHGAEHGAGKGAPAPTFPASNGGVRTPGAGPVTTSPSDAPSTPSPSASSPASSPAPSPASPSGSPTGSSSGSPSGSPSGLPTGGSTGTPGETPSDTSSPTPTRSPSTSPDDEPTSSDGPSDSPTEEPSCTPATPGEQLTAAITGGAEDDSELACPPCGVPGEAVTPLPESVDDDDEVCEAEPAGTE